jgi:TrmH family RNA methyltransferase
LLKELRRLARDASAYRKLGRFWIEGEHLCAAALSRGQKPELAVFSESFWQSADPVLVEAAGRCQVVADPLFRDISALESPAGMGFVMPWSAPGSILTSCSSVILDRVQDAGNVGSILRSASAFGFMQVLALTGTAALWSPKVLRAGMGAHFALHLQEGLEPADLAALQLPLLATSSHEGMALAKAPLPVPCAWVFGHEGQGVCPELLKEAAQRIRIAQPGGEESLNVAAAAAICLHASALAASRA